MENSTVSSNLPKGSEFSTAVDGAVMPTSTNSTDEQPGMIIGKCGVTQIVNIPILMANGEYCWQTVQLTAVEPINSYYAAEDESGEQVLLIDNGEHDGYEQDESMSVDEDETSCQNDVSAENSGSKNAEKRRRHFCKCPNCVERKRTRESSSQSSSNPSDKSLNPLLHMCPLQGCMKTFQKTSHLKSHIRSHSDERPFKCTASGCNRAFTRSDQLGRHMRIHSAEKAFACEKCGKRFTRRDHYKKHMVARHLKQREPINKQ